jgi:hypothetical protein
MNEENFPSEIWGFSLDRSGGSGASILIELGVNWIKVLEPTLQ